MYQGLELADGIDIVSLDCYNSEHDNDIYSIFGGDEANNFVEMGNLIDFEQVYGNPEIHKRINFTYNLDNNPKFLLEQYNQVEEAFKCIHKFEILNPTLKEDEINVRNFMF